MTIILLGRCARIGDSWAHFIFKGYYSSRPVEKIVVQSNYSWERGADYVVHLKVSSVEQKTLYAELIRAKKI